MSVKLVILGMLKRGPMYGYELKSQIEHEMGDWTSIAFGSIYFALKKLTEDGFVKHAGTEQKGNRPSRIIYRITDTGEKEFDRLLLKIWTDSDRHYFPMDIGLYFIDHLKKNEALKLIENKMIETEHGLTYLENHRKYEIERNEVPPIAEAIFSHSLYHLKAELEWLTEVKEGLEKSK